MTPSRNTSLFWLTTLTSSGKRLFWRLRTMAWDDWLSSSKVNGPRELATLPFAINLQNRTIHATRRCRTGHEPQLSISFFRPPCLSSGVLLVLLQSSVLVLLSLWCVLTLTGLGWTFAEARTSGSLSGTSSYFALSQQPSVSQRKSGPCYHRCWLESFWGFTPREASSSGLTLPGQCLHWSGKVEFKLP